MIRKGKARIITKFHRTVLVICSHSREGKPVLYSNKYGILYFYLDHSSKKMCDSDILLSNNTSLKDCCSNVILL